MRKSSAAILPDLMSISDLAVRLFLTPGIIDHGPHPFGSLRSLMARRTARKPGAIRPSAPPARSTAPTPARSTSRSRTAASSKIDGGDDNPVTRNFICAKVRRFDERVYGEDRVLLPGGPQGREGQGDVRPRHLGRGARSDRPTDAGDPRTAGAEAILPFYYGGSNGLLTQNTNDAELWRRFGTSRLARTVCAAPTGAANLGALRQDAGRRLPGLPAREADRPVGRQSVRVGHSSRPLHQGSAATPARRSSSSIRARRRSREHADLHLAPHPGTDLPVALALHRVLFEGGHADGVPRRSTRTAPTPARARRAVDDRARRAEAGIDRGCSSGSPISTRRHARRSSAAAGASSAIATAAARPRPSWRCRPSAASSACAAAASR